MSKYYSSTNSKNDTTLNSIQYFTLMQQAIIFLFEYINPLWVSFDALLLWEYQCLVTNHFTWLRGNFN